MITRNGGLAVDFSTVKAIKMEYFNQGSNLVFELNNILIPIKKPETEIIEMCSFGNDPIIQYFENSDSCTAYFEEWIELWEDYKKNSH